MIISDKQKDSITELINIGFSKSAASLSELTGYRILLSVPEVKILPIDELSSELKVLVPENISTVHQVFNGPISGDAMLILSQIDSQTLTQLLLNEPENDIHGDATIREVLTEVGNILLNSCLGMFGNILKIQITFSVPQLQLETLDKLIRTLTIDNNELSYALMVTMEFHLRDKSVSGYLVLVLGVTSLDRFLEEIEKLG
jgi:chemotaxis protein CheC